MDEPNCGNCRYFHETTQRGLMRDGECHIRSTNPWPPRLKEDWCGEHPNFPAWIEAVRRETELPEITVTASVGAAAPGVYETRASSTLDASPHVIHHPPGTGKFEAEVSSAVDEINEPIPSCPAERAP